MTDDKLVMQTDATKNYVDWAVKNHFAVMDVNIPRHITDLEVCPTRLIKCVGSARI